MDRMVISDTFCDVSGWDLRILLLDEVLSRRCGSPSEVRRPRSSLHDQGSRSAEAKDLPVSKNKHLVRIKGCLGSIFTFLS